MSDGPTIDYKQEGRLLQIDTTLGEDKLLLEKFSGAETLSKPFEFRVTMLSTELDVDIKSLLRTSVTVALILSDGEKRYFNGVFHSVMQAQEDSDAQGGPAMGMSHPEHELATYEAIIVPKVWFLSLDANCKIFQAMSVPDIVSSVLKEAGVTDFEFNTLGTYPVREYCVQYRESSLAFISRLLEEEGIFYYFTHEETKHTLNFVDKNTAGGTVPGQDTVKYAYDQDGWVGGGDEEDKEEGVARLERIETVFTGKASLTDYDFTKPKTSLLGTTGSENEEAFDYPGEYTEIDDGTRYSRIRLEERESVQFVVNGVSVCRSFQPGYYFTLEDHYREDTNQDYFLISVNHEAVDATYRSNKGVAESYGNTFTAIPNEVAYRPPRDTPRPTVKGLQPALVVGKEGEEIWVDQYGRVKVQFYWDRVGTKNENSSCWVRVAQIWAGKNWGWMTIPRIGQEVLVDFLEGDPDRPIIVGRVYNADQTVPWDLPANQTQSGILTRSSKGGSADTANYLQFEDKMGSEQINVWAQKDMNTTVENNDTQTVNVDRTITVKGKHTETITGDTTITIQTGKHDTTVQTANQSITVSQGNQSTTISMGNQSTTISMGNQTTSVTMGSISTDAMQAITLTVGPSSISITPEGVTIAAPMVTITGDAMVTISADALLDMSGAITLINT
jgi:type VI secretion system secreted protein VgrG